MPKLSLDSFVDELRYAADTGITLTFGPEECGKLADLMGQAAATAKRDEERTASLVKNMWGYGSGQGWPT